MWKTLSGKECDDPYSLIKRAVQNERTTLHIGADSQSYKDKTIVITTICLREERHGVVVFWQSETIERPRDLHAKLLYETMKCIEVATEVREKTNTLPVVHLDVSPHSENDSNKFYNELTGMVSGCGFEVVTKPNCFAASIADMFTR